MCIEGVDTFGCFFLPFLNWRKLSDPLFDMTFTLETILLACLVHSPHTDVFFCLFFPPDINLGFCSAYTAWECSQHGEAAIPNFISSVVLF